MTSNPNLQPGYGMPSPYAPARGTNTMAILALVFAFVFFPLGIVFGFIARSQIKRTGEDGSGLALAGIVVGFAILGLFVLGVLGAVMIGVATSSSTTTGY